MRVNFILPTEYIGGIMKLCADRRGTYVRTGVPLADAGDARLDLPLADVIYDLYDKLKSMTAATARWTTRLIGYGPPTW